MASRLLNWIFAAFLAWVGLYLAIRGYTLISLGGSAYYLLAGIGLVGVTLLLLVRSAMSSLLYALIVALTVIWSFTEAGLDLIALLPRLGAWVVVGLWFLTPWHSAAMSGKSGQGRWVGFASLIAVALLALSAMQKGEVIPFERTVTADVASEDDWVRYGNSDEGTRFSTLTQITPENVDQLEEVWRTGTGIPWEFKSTPIQVNDKLYTCLPGNFVLALDAETGEEIFRFDPENKLTGSTLERLARGNTYSRGCRGVAYHEAPADYAGETCKERILTGTTDSRMHAIDAHTGEHCPDFGENGEIDLRLGLGQHNIFAYFHSSVPLIAKDNVVVGGWVLDNQELGNPSGVLRAFSAVTGEFVWAFDVGRPGDPSLPPEGETFTLGTPNVWTLTSYDPELDLVFAPTGNAAPDYYGAKRREIDEEINASVVALNGTTGELEWVYRTVYHDIWDYDVPSQPTLLTIKKDGEEIPVVAQGTKRGEMFLLDRRDGTPIWPATDCPDGSAPTALGECPVPQGPAPGDWLSPVQPFSGLPRFNESRFEKDMWGLTPLDQLYCRIEFKKMRYDGHFTPIMPGGGVMGRDETWGGTFQYPGNQGGYNWPSVSVDAENGLLIAQPMLLGNRIYLMTPEERMIEAAGGPGALDEHDISERRAAIRDLPDTTGQGAWDADAPRYAATGRFISKWKIPFTDIASDMPCFEPPYGVLAVMDLNNNQLLWKRPIGNMTDLGPFGIKPGLSMFEVGTPVYGGTMTTRSGLIFQVGTLDSTFRAIDIANGKTLWSTRLPATSNSTPITYTRNGRQYVVVQVPDDPQDGAPDGAGEIIAYALPE